MTKINGTFIVIEHSAYSVKYFNDLRIALCYFMASTDYSAFLRYFPQNPDKDCLTWNRAKAVTCFGWLIPTATAQNYRLLRSLSKKL